MKVVGTQRSQILASRIARELDMELVATRFSRFPDGEQYLQTGLLDGRTVVVGSVIDSDSFVQLLLLLDACQETEITLVLPYMGYARQDKQFKRGEPLSARAVARALGEIVNRVITVQVHDPAVLVHFGIPATNLTPALAIADEITRQGYPNPMILAPDDGAAGFAAAIARAGSWQHDHLEKTRLSGEEVRMEGIPLDVLDRTVILVDDIISTGGTLAAAARMLRSKGAGSVHAICIHGVFTGGAYGFLRTSGIQDLLASDTIENGYSRYSVARPIAKAILEC